MRHARMAAARSIPADDSRAEQQQKTGAAEGPGVC
jgi:hypothetical protein